MAAALEDVRPVDLAEIRAARARIGATIVRTPLIRLELGPDFPDIRLKLENLQPINAYKLRGAANAVATMWRALSPAVSYCPFGESCSRNTSGSTIGRIFSP